MAAGRSANSQVIRCCQCTKLNSNLLQIKTKLPNELHRPAPTFTLFDVSHGEHQNVVVDVIRMTERNWPMNVGDGKVLDDIVRFSVINQHVAACGEFTS